MWSGHGGCRVGRGWACGSPCGASGQAFPGDAPSGHHSGQEPNTLTLSNSTMTSWGRNQGPGKESGLPGARQLVQAEQNTYSRTLSVLLGRDAGGKKPTEALGSPELRLHPRPLASFLGGSGQHGA